MILLRTTVTLETEDADQSADCDCMIGARVIGARVIGDCAVRALCDGSMASPRGRQFIK